MVSADSQTGAKPYFEPLRNELIDCFTAIKDVSGGVTYGSGTGLVDTSKPQNNNGAGDGASNDIETMIADIDEEKKKGKGNRNIYLSTRINYITTIRYHLCNWHILVTHIQVNNF